MAQGGEGAGQLEGHRAEEVVAEVQELKGKMGNWPNRIWKGQRVIGDHYRVIRKRISGSKFGK